MRRVSVLLVIAMVGVFVPMARVDAQSLTASCRADLPVIPGALMTWRATVQGNVGTPAYEWTGTDGLTGTEEVTTHSYGSTGYVTAHVAVTDPVAGENAAADCAMHVIPVSFSEPPSVTPVLWVPKGTDPTPLVAPLKRTWRAIHALFFHFYGRTFRMHAFTVVVSAYSETDLCGGDCTDTGQSNTLVYQALADAEAAIGGTIPYTRAMLVMPWGGGGWAGSWSWDIARGVIGDFAVAPAADTLIPAVEPNVADWLIEALGDYDYAVYGAVAHELNHVIAWDDPHDFSLSSPPNDYERAVARAGPFLKKKLADPVQPDVSFIAPSDGATISGTADVALDASDDVAMDAVLLLVDQHVVGIDPSAPFAFPLDTTQLGFGDHTLTAVALDTTGNMREVSQNVQVVNEVPGTGCDTSYPAGTFHACFYQGIGTGGAYLGTLVDHPFPQPSSNVGFGVDHDWQDGFIAFNQFDHVTGVWRGKLDFPAGTYLCRFHTDDGLRVWIDGNLVVDAWQAPQVADFSTVASMSGSTRIRIKWFENDGSAGLRFWWAPTNPSAARAHVGERRFGV